MHAAVESDDIRENLQPQRRLSLLHRFAYRVYHGLIFYLRTSRWVHRGLFGYRPCVSSSECGEYWDWTTLTLRKAIRLYLRRDMSLLDVGTGSAGVLAVFAGLKTGCRRIVGVDKVPKVVSLAQRAAEPLRLGIEFRCSDLFSNVTGRFDMIVFNAPYLDDEKARQLGILRSDLDHERFSGGAGGGETIARFLDGIPEHLLDDGCAVLGVNHYHIARTVIMGLIAGSKLRLERRLEGRCLPATAYMLRRAEAKPGEPIP
jgi:methylase of polypeptide subunit release factors